MDLSVLCRGSQTLLKVRYTRTRSISKVTLWERQSLVFMMFRNLPGVFTTMKGAIFVDPCGDNNMGMCRGAWRASSAEVMRRQCSC